jgi:hypothetical protein
MAVPGPEIGRIDDMIAALQGARDEVGGDAPVALKGRDGRWSELGRVLVSHEEDEAWILVTDGLEVTPGFEVGR